MAFMIRNHKRVFWLVPTETTYMVSVIKPSPEELPYGTASNLYGVGEGGDRSIEILDTVKSSKTII